MRVRPFARATVTGRRRVRITVVGLGVAVFAFAGQTLWDQLGSVTALIVSLGLVTLAAVDAVTAWTGLRRPVVHADAPGEVFTGEAMELGLVVHGVSRGCTLSVVSLRGVSPVRVVADTGGAVCGVVVARAPIRGVVRRVVVELDTAGLFGLFTVHRRLVVPLPDPVYVAPAPSGPIPDGPLRPVHIDDDRAEVPHPGRAGLGDPRGVRPYVPGDPRRTVHWPATAREGALMVREPDAPVVPPTVAVVLRIEPNEPGNEAAVARCRALLEAALAQGSSVRLTTAEARDRSLPSVDWRAVAARRRAVVLEPAVPTDVAEVERAVVGPGDLHRRLARAEVHQVPAAPGGEGGENGMAAHSPGGRGERRWCVRGSGEDGWL